MGMASLSRENMMKKPLLPKISLLVQIGNWYFHTNPSNIGLDRDVNDRYPF